MMTQNSERSLNGKRYRLETFLTSEGASGAYQYALEQSFKDPTYLESA